MPTDSDDPIESDLQLESTRGRTLRLADHRGKVLVVFYEGFGHTDANEALKQACGRAMESGVLSGWLEVLGVADLGGLSLGPVKRVVRLAVAAVAKRYGVELHLDFDGALTRAPYGLLARSANVAILDARGAVVFRAHGRLDGPAVAEFSDALSAALLDAGATKVATPLERSSAA